MIMPFSNYIYEYFDGISSGEIVVGKWVRLLYEYIIRGLQEGLFTFDAKKANKAISSNTKTGQIRAGQSKATR